MLRNHRRTWRKRGKCKINRLVLDSYQQGELAATSKRAVPHKIMFRMKMEGGFTRNVSSVGQSIGQKCCSCSREKSSSCWVFGTAFYSPTNKSLSAHIGEPIGYKEKLWPCGQHWREKFAKCLSKSTRGSTGERTPIEEHVVCRCRCEACAPSRVLCLFEWVLRCLWL